MFRFRLVPKLSAASLIELLSNDVTDEVLDSRRVLMDIQRPHMLSHDQHNLVQNMYKKINDV